LKKIIYSNEVNFEGFILDSTATLTIVVPPEIKKENLQPLDFIKNILKKISKITKPGGTCCFIITDYIDPKDDIMKLDFTKAFFQFVDSSENKDWDLDDEIIWVKSSKTSVEGLNKIKNGLMINFDQTPFSKIYALTKKGSKLELETKEEKLNKLKISELKKEEMSDSVWFSQPKKEKNFKDFLTKEIASRLIMLYSNENDLIVDPFAGSCVTALVSKTLGRDYFCMDNNQDNIENAKNRIIKAE